jgi:exodeoxyribonuclease VII large subunit
LVVEHLEERGEGKLRRAYELLKKKLEEAGLFDPAHKKPLPAFPAQIGVVTSATGAAIRDILTVLKRRFPCVPIIIYPTLVQGEIAAPAIVKALQTANQRNECDVLILARGGGSLEDLWPFNDESVAHAIYQSQIPIISGVGHEVDFTIADFVADKRAPTPSAAAEMAVPDQDELCAVLSRLERQLFGQMRKQLAVCNQHLAWAQKHLSQQHPKRRLLEKMQRLDFLELSFVQWQGRFLNKLQQQIKEAQAKLHQLTPAHKINQFSAQLEIKQRQCTASIATLLAKHQTGLAQAAGKLDALSPLATLGRGYAIVTAITANGLSADSHRVLRSADEIAAGDSVNIRLARGTLHCLVEKSEDDTP